jgi:hypothetical protein
MMKVGVAIISDTPEKKENGAVQAEATFEEHNNHVLCSDAP